ncbi:MAG: DegV family protein [Ruminococcus sp.]|nr:DegV family protein [Ruminococcus sp.]
MKKFRILCDITCDLNEKFQKEFDIDVLSGHMTLPDKTEKVTYPKWVDTTAEKFYTDLKKDPNGYSTAPPNVAEFTEVFEKFVSEGCDVLTMTISGGMSGTFNFASKAREAVLEKHPDANIKVVDSRRFTTGFGLMAVNAAILRNEGKSMDEVAEYIENNKNRYHQAGWLDDLSFVAKKGRLTHSKAFFGKLAGIKPLGEFDYNGLTTVIGKAKGAKKAYPALLSYIGETIENPEEQIVFIAHTNRLPQAEQYKKMIEEKFHPKAIYINDVYPANGINIGPGLMAAYYFGKPISEGLKEETEIINKYLK